MTAKETIQTEVQKERKTEKPWIGAQGPVGSSPRLRILYPVV